MKKSYPKEVVFLLADDFREELGDKHTLLGLYSGDAILIKGKKDSVQAMHSIVIYVIFKDGGGVFKSRIELTDPTDFKNSPEPSELVKVKNQNVAIIAKFAPFKLIEGLHNFSIYLDEKKYSYSFAVVFTE